MARLRFKQFAMRSRQMSSLKEQPYSSKKLKLNVTILPEMTIGVYNNGI